MLILGTARALDAVPVTAVGAVTNRFFQEVADRSRVAFY